MSPPAVMIVERVSPHEWPRVRSVRLRALADAPDAFRSTLADEVDMPDDAWQARLSATDCATFIAASGGDDVGIAVGAPYNGAAGLFAMWVAPEARGNGMGDALIAAVVDWAKEYGHERLVLDVGDWNEPAIKLYARNGFERTGHTGILPPPRSHLTEHRRVRRLR